MCAVKDYIGAHDIRDRRTRQDERRRYFIHAHVHRLRDALNTVTAFSRPGHYGAERVETKYL